MPRAEEESELRGERPHSNPYADSCLADLEHITLSPSVGAIIAEAENMPRDPLDRVDHENVTRSYQDTLRRAERLRKANATYGEHEHRRQELIRRVTIQDDLLRAHDRLLEPLNATFSEQFVILIQTDPATSRDMRTHTLNAHVVTADNGTAYDIMQYFSTGITPSLHLAVSKLCDYYHEESRMKYDLKIAEIRYNRHIDPNYQYVEEAAANTYSRPGFGLGNHRERLALYSPRFTGDHRVKHVIASCEIRKVRLEHALHDGEDECCAVGKVWAGSLDAVMVRWVVNVRDAYRGCALEDDLEGVTSQTLSSMLEMVETFATNTCEAAEEALENAYEDITAKVTTDRLRVDRCTDDIAVIELMRRHSLRKNDAREIRKQLEAVAASLREVTMSDVEDEA